MNEQRAYEKSLRCIRCGFCLEACPTFVLTGRETESPRGRIYLVKSALESKLDWDRDVRSHLDSCLGCRACETACPSGVEYGSILELARERLGTRSRPTRIVLNALTDRGKSSLLAGLRRLLPIKRAPSLAPGQRSQADIPIPESDLECADEYPEPTRTVYLLDGCVMPSMFRRSHDATKHLLRRHACDVLPLKSCCGALLTHNGMTDGGRDRARALIDAATVDHPIITDSAGCGSAMKEFSELLADDPAYRDRAATFSARVRDVSEFLSQTGYEHRTTKLSGRVTYHDACHLAHGQGIRDEPRELLAGMDGVEFVEMEESDRCCGSAGIYNMTQPGLARELLDRKWAFVEATGAKTVVTGNPGCLAWLRQAAREKKSDVRVVHTSEALL